jgi:predicted RND superfamily exporter protein
MRKKMKKNLIFLTLITIVLAGCVSEEKTSREIEQSIDTQDTTSISLVSADEITAEEKADVENDSVILKNSSKKSENITSLESAKANEELRDRINKELEEAAKKRDAQTTTLLITPTTTSTTQADAIDEPITDSSIKVEVYHFHGNSQCVSCITVGAYAEETVNTYFSQELKDGRLVFAHVNYDLQENKTPAGKYGVTGSSLWIGAYKGGKFSKEENVNVWYKINNKGDYLSYLKGVISAKLA